VEWYLNHQDWVEKVISLCSVDVIFLSDQDDVWFPEKIEVVLSTFRSKKGALVVINDVRITDEYLKPTSITLMEQIHSTNLSDEFFVYGYWKKPIFTLAYSSNDVPKR